MRNSPTKVDLSVIICTRNRPKKLEKCLFSIFKNRVLPKEIIIIDSSDKEILLPNLRNNISIILKKVRHVNLAYSRNQGLKIASSIIIAFIDDDAIADKYWTETIIDTYSKFPNVVGMGGMVYPLTKNYWSGAAARIFYKGMDLISRKDISDVDGFAGVNSSFRKRYLKKYKITFDESYKTGEDVVLCYEIKRMGGKLLFNPNVKVKHEFRNSMLDFFLRYYSYALDEYRYWSEYPEFSGAGSYLPRRKLEWAVLPIFCLLKFVDNVHNYSSIYQNRARYLGAIVIFQTAYFLGIYRKYFEEKLALTLL